MSKNQVSLNDAKAWSKKWQSENPKHCKGFLIPAIDIIQTLEIMEVLVKQQDGSYKLQNVTDAKIRSYTAIDDSQQEGFGEKLLFLGTHKDSKGVYRDIIEGQKVPGTENLNGSGIFDFTTPCPSDCDNNSPLVNP